MSHCTNDIDCNCHNVPWRWFNFHCTVWINLERQSWEFCTFVSPPLILSDHIACYLFRIRNLGECLHLGQHAPSASLNQRRHRLMSQTKPKTSRSSNNISVRIVYTNSPWFEVISVSIKNSVSMTSHGVVRLCCSLTSGSWNIKSLKVLATLVTLVGVYVFRGFPPAKVFLEAPAAQHAQPFRCYIIE